MLLRCSIAILILAAPAFAAPAGVFVAVGYGGRRIVSDDGISWEIAAEWKENGGDDNLNLSGLAWGKGRFVCVGGGGAGATGGGHILTSTDGREWKSVYAAKSRIIPVLFGNDRFVAIGPGARFLTSDDGEKWGDGAKIQFDKATHPRMGAFGNGVFVVIGDNGGGSKIHWAVVTKDGRSILAEVPDLPPLRDLVFGNGRFVAVGPEGLRISSKDGIKWDNATGEKGLDISSVAWTGKEFVVPHWQGAYTSADGIDWKKADYSVPVTILYADAERGRYIGTGWPGQMWSSVDGKKWTRGKPMTPNGINRAIFGGKPEPKAEPKVDAPTDPGFASIRGLLDTHCATCHGSKAQKGGVNLAAYTTPQSVLKDRKLWKTVAEQIDAKEMPPSDRKALTAEQRIQVVGWIRGRIESAELADRQTPDPGRPVVRRLTRTEYNRSIRDLLGVDFDVSEAVGLPDDTLGENFDNLSSALNFSDSLMEKYFTSAELVVERLFAEPARKERKPLGKNEKAPAIEKILPALPGKTSTPTEAARAMLVPLLRRAFRRPATEAEVGRLLALIESRIGAGVGFEEAIRPAIKAVLVSPHFLIRIERDRRKDDRPWKVADTELATRLSYFLWSSLPDGELDALADAGTLSQPDILEAQIRRMLSDPKAAALTESFAVQWLRLGKLAQARPSTEFFPTFTPELRLSMFREVTGFFDHLRRDDASLLKLIDADYTFANRALGEHYGIKNLPENEFAKVGHLDRTRGGLTGMAAILAMTSHTNRTSPTLRGKYILDVILGTPPAPPPANAGTIDESKTGKEAKNFREQLAQHASQSSCAGCHAKIDPLGFGLENFDAIGRFRKTTPDIDPTGKLPGGESFTGSQELRKVLMGKRDQFLRTATEKMLTYALGRELTAKDEPTIRDILADLATHDHKLNRLIALVAKSYPMTHRRAWKEEE